MLEEGIKAPDFSLESDSGQTVSLSDFKGKKVVLYFYPKDDTPGCTKEACGFRDQYAAITAKNTVVIGISGDPVKSHLNFKDKYNLPFFLLSDPDKKTIQSYRAWGEKKNYGKIYLGLLRSTYIIDEQGTIIKVFPKVKPDGHAEQILKYL